jgi:hypothetical protein
MPHYSAKLALFTLALLSLGLPARAQATQAPALVPAAPATPGAPSVAPAPTSFSIVSLRPALANVQTAIATLNVAHWKAPSEIRAATQQDIGSMQRDLNTTLPGLMAQAEAAATNGSGPLSPSFAVFRNLDALYDVLLRVTETASLAGSGADASSLEDARAGLEDGRAKLGAWLLQSIGAQDALVARAQVSVPHPAAQPAGPAKVVVNDGPDTTKPHKKKPALAPQ